MSVVYKQDGHTASAHYPHDPPGHRVVDLSPSSPAGAMGSYDPYAYSDAPTSALEEIPQEYVDALASPNPVRPNRPRATRSIIEREYPETKNSDGHWICTYGECDAPNHNKVFPTLAKFHNHMDRHYRPFVCKQPGCERVQGFTYGAGLMRHEREVHGMHGGPNNRLQCPHLDCKRHATGFFTRPDNLNEHIRRCHVIIADKGEGNASRPPGPQRIPIQDILSGESGGFGAPPSRPRPPKRKPTEDLAPEPKRYHTGELTLDPMPSRLTDDRDLAALQTENADLRCEIARLKGENDAFKAQMAEMMTHIGRLETERRV
ncbi:hypothetical protein F4778DRAFT_761257 [Xylariomycetidae sp. FL2044]|nr:hypothetical protein F4778DRAFT_761257 [Xylariomycetidae sp. FL2044]